jgi:D-glycero-D-manno-heptose 1,7-bisphosphate phosphatase
MKKALFLDRDGVINLNDQRYYVYRVEDFQFIPGIFNIVKKFHDKGYLVVVVTNQSGIAKGKYTPDHVYKVNDYMIDEFSRQGITITNAYFCPHHPVKSNCLCRKPGSLMLEKAIARYQIDPRGSLMIGDSQRDVQAARKAGVKGILVKKNLPLQENKEILEIIKNI